MPCPATRSPAPLDAAPSPEVRPSELLPLDVPDPPGEYSIRVVAKRGLRCADCGGATGRGPVGHRGENPVCDDCLLQGCGQLGMLLAVAMAARNFAAVDPADAEGRREALLDLVAFAEVYDRFAARYGERRPPLGPDQPA